LAIATYPFLPESSQKIWVQLGMHDNISAQGFDEISNISIKQGHKLGKISPLFQKVEESVIKEQSAKLGDSM
jgi:methionyl-tRNA synthetase